MPPPPVPWFRGRTIVLAPSPDGISIRALGTHAFVSPAKMRELTLPTSMLVLAIAEGAALAFRGIFTGAGLPSDVVLAPIDPDDAVAVEQVLCEQLGLPRIPRRVAMADLERCADGELVRVEGTYRDQHLDAISIDSGELVEGRRYRVFGFYRSDGRLLPVEITQL